MHSINWYSILEDGFLTYYRWTPIRNCDYSFLRDFADLGADFLRFRSGDLRAPACLGPDSLVFGLSSTATAAGATSPNDSIDETGAAAATTLRRFSGFGFLTTVG